MASRLAGVIFFVGFQPAEYRMLGYFDLVFFVPELDSADDDGLGAGIAAAAAAAHRRTR